MEELYREQILDRYKAPRHRGHLEDYDIAYEDDNPTCGDHIRIELKVKDGRVVDARFDGQGCAISQASADLLLDEVIGKPLDEVKQLSKDDLLEILGITLGPVRLKCALLSLKVLKAGVYGLGQEKEN